MGKIGFDNDKYVELQSKNIKDRIAAFGFDIGAGSEVYSTIKNAEQMMYADKERYYTETGKDRRR